MKYNLERIKYFLKLTICTALMSFNLCAQDVVNFYKQPPVNLSDFYINNQISSFSRDFIFNSQFFRDYNNGIFFNSQNFDGEYEMCLILHPWYYIFVTPVLNINPHPAYVYAVTYNYEVVSFPFHINCAYSNGAICEESDPDCSTHKRELTLPIEDNNHFAYYPNLGYMQYVNPPTPTATDKLFLKTPIQSFTDVFSDPVNATLISGCFKSNGGIVSQRQALPHSVIKIALNLHCGPNTTDPIIKTQTYYYDNTRGRMRYYPFKACNSMINGGSINTSQHDVVFYPEIIYDENNPPDYQNTNSNSILTNGTLNYFPVSENILPPTCTSATNIPLPTDFYDPHTILNSNLNTYSNIAVNSYLMFPAPFTLQSCLLRGVDGYYPAGYDAPSTNTPTYLTLKPGIRHSYFIDQNTDLNIINPTEKEIYNPSEATITASNFVFPQDYTFKTIRGVYPSEAEALASRIIENGCDANTDLREVPVKTDLTTENTTDAVNFPLSALPATQHLYASRYYLENNSKLTVQQCVSLFDCTFDVKQGATLLFDDYPTHYGKEDYSYDRANTRFKIQTLGGAVLRNYNDVQYLQNGDITQTLPLHYKAIREIYAGSNVDPDQDIPKQDYVAQGGSNITMQAGEVIYLKEGFHAMSGSNVHIMPTSPGGSAGPCNLPIAARMAAATQQHQQKKYETLPALNIYPNPTANVVKLHNRFMPLKAERLVIVDVYGRTVYEQVNFNSILHTPDFSHEPNGMYLAKVMQQGKTETLKFMVQH